MTYSRQNTGKIGEEVTVRFLEQRGYRILSRNFRCYLGEIDIIARQNGELVFIEVKTRTSQIFGLPQEAVGYRKQKKLKQLALFYITMHQPKEKGYRFDVVAVTLGFSGGLPQIELIKNAF
jgi:putative endonuclease